MKKKVEKLNQEKFDFDKRTKVIIYTLIFFIGSIVGYIYEVLFFLIMDNELVNRGFLYGPYLPVYGFGAVFIVLFLKKYKKNPLVVFLLTMILTGILEYITGYLMFKIYHRTWWDYTGLFLNIDGYVCLRSVLTFAIGGLFLIYVVEPLICKYINKLGKMHKYALLVSIFLIMIIDLSMTLMFRNKL